MDIQTDNIEVARLLLAWKITFNIFGAMEKLKTPEQLAGMVYEINMILKTGNVEEIQDIQNKALTFEKLQNEHLA